MVLFSSFRRLHVSIRSKLNIRTKKWMTCSKITACVTTRHGLSPDVPSKLQCKVHITKWRYRALGILLSHYCYI